MCVVLCLQSLLLARNIYEQLWYIENWDSYLEDMFGVGVLGIRELVVNLEMSFILEFELRSGSFGI